VVGHSEWIARKVDEMCARAPPSANHVPSSIELAALSETWTVRHERDDRSTLYAGSDRELTVACANGGERAGLRLLQAWLRSRAHLAFAPWLARVASETGIEFERVEIRRQRTRWGSCSRRGVLSLNACLLFQRPEVVRYLLVHELCHRVHMNHSQQFWALVAHHEPGFRTLDRELGQGWRRVPDWVFTA
jgi:predicted metal-dependent hydrolase